MGVKALIVRHPILRPPLVTLLFRALPPSFKIDLVSNWVMGHQINCMQESPNWAFALDRRLIWCLLYTDTPLLHRKDRAAPLIAARPSAMGRLRPEGGRLAKCTQPISVRTGFSELL